MKQTTPHEQINNCKLEVMQVTNMKTAHAKLEVFTSNSITSCMAMAIEAGRQTTDKSMASSTQICGVKTHASILYET